MTHSDFQTLTASFIDITPKQAHQLATTEGSILFIGRESCPYCQRFLPKLANVARKHAWKVYFLDTQNPLFSPDDVSHFRQQYQISTVPALLYRSANQTSVRCDSTMTEEDIFRFIQ